MDPYYYDNILVVKCQAFFKKDFEKILFDFCGHFCQNFLPNSVGKSVGNSGDSGRKSGIQVGAKSLK